MTPDNQIMFDQNHEHVILKPCNILNTLLINQGKVLIFYLFTLINDGGVVAEIEIESLLRTR